ncbi:MAG: lipoate--protein ligase family protein [Candidatus Bathyarchaeota archaeon]|nr:MAG: lipoate--protein ligase family protein [Candidatus Bathyarchaeota archaeon]
MSIWRLLKPEVQNAFINMSIDEAILQARIEEKTSNTLRFFRWHPSAVSIGRFQNIHSVVNLEACKINGIDVVRRISGGGAVYHDTLDEITYSVTVNREDLGTKDVAKAYSQISNGLIEAAHILGVNAKYNRGDLKQCPNIVVKERKISGSAQANRKGVILQHGTFLMNVDLKKMFTFLKAPWKDSCVDILTIAKRRITSVADELGNPIPINHVFKALAKGFERALNIELVEGVLTDYELRLAGRLAKEKFSTLKWNFEGKTSPLGSKPIS